MSLVCAEAIFALCRLLYMWSVGGWLLPRVRGFWENVRQFILRLRFFFFFLFNFFEVEISSRTLIPLFGQDQSTSGSAS